MVLVKIITRVIPFERSYVVVEMTTWIHMSRNIAIPRCWKLREAHATNIKILHNNACIHIYIKHEYNAA